METTKRSWNAAARAAAAAAIAAVPVAAQAQTPIEPSNIGVYTSADFDFDFGDIDFDIDGDGLFDFNFASFYGSDLMLSPLASADPPAAVLTDETSDIARFETAADVFAVAETSDSSDFTRTISDPFMEPVSRFLEPGFFGLLFEIPGGSPYIAAIEIQIGVDENDNFTQVEIIGGSFQLVPTPGALALFGLVAGTGLRRRR